MYIVNNLTSTTVVLPDIRAEIGPYKILDLEHITSRDQIDRSLSLRQAMRDHKLRLVKHSIVRTESVPEPTVERIIEKHIDEEKMMSLFRQMLHEQASMGTKEVAQPQHDPEVKDLIRSLRDQINNLSAGPAGAEKSGAIDTPVDAERLADIHQSNISKISEGIEIKVPEQNKIKIISKKNVNDLASEL